ncbi:MAG: L,D-transpeptidase [Coprobacillus sp.]|nr:L,D-transpeptidase [Coprobacillus sp.]
MYKKLLNILIVMFMTCTNLTFVFANDTKTYIDFHQQSAIEGYKYKFLVQGVKSSYAWTGKSIQPSMTLWQEKTNIKTNKKTTQKLIRNKDYTVSYKNNHRVGTGYIIIKGKGRYTGNLSKKFKIVIKNNVRISVKNLKSQSAQIQFNKMSGIKKYDIILKNESGKILKTIPTTKTKVQLSHLKKGTKYHVVLKAYAQEKNKVNYKTLIASVTFRTRYVVDKVNISSVKSGNEMAQVNWKAVKDISGYEIYRSTNAKSGFKKIKTVSQKTKSYTDFLLGVKTYYYKVRAYKKVKGQTIYGAFSQVKSCRTKKATNKTYYLRVNIKTNITTAHAKNFSGKYVPVKALTTSCGISGRSKPILGTHYTMVKYRWKYMHEDCYTQYATRIAGHYLFHSVPYSQPKPYTLWYNSYNKLGSFASDGCVRLSVIDAKWIYDHCPLKTKVVVVYHKSDPLKKPKVKKINTRNRNRIWDPTDPDPKNPWKK